MICGITGNEIAQSAISFPARKFPAPKSDLYKIATAQQSPIRCTVRKRAQYLLYSRCACIYSEPFRGIAPKVSIDMERVLDTSKYKEPFVKVTDDLDELMTKNYNGKSVEVSTIQDGVKMSYHLPETSEDEAASKAPLLVVFNVFHDKAGTFTGYFLERETEIGRRYNSLPADIKNVISKYSVPKSSPKSTGVNVFDEVLKRLEQAMCTEVTYEKIDYGMNFKGLYKRYQIRLHCLRWGERTT